jgi:hypothetical protein
MPKKLARYEFLRLLQDHPEGVTARQAASLSRKEGRTRYTQRTANVSFGELRELGMAHIDAYSADRFRAPIWLVGPGQDAPAPLLNRDLPKVRKEPLTTDERSALIKAGQNLRRIRTDKRTDLDRWACRDLSTLPRLPYMRPFDSGAQA